MIRAVITEADVATLTAKADRQRRDASSAGPGEAVPRGGEVVRGRVRSPSETTTPALAGVPHPDTWYERLLKFIPAESVALYLALEGIVRTPELSEGARQAWLAIVLAFALLFTWLYLRRASEIAPTTAQLLVSSGALVVYVFALGGVFATFDFYQPWQGTLLLVATTAFLSLYIPPAAVDES